MALCFIHLVSSHEACWGVYVPKWRALDPSQWCFKGTQHVKKSIKAQKAIKKRSKGFVSPEVALAGKPRSGSDWSCCSNFVLNKYFCLLLLEDETLI